MTRAGNRMVGALLGAALIAAVGCGPDANDRDAARPGGGVTGAPTGATPGAARTPPPAAPGAPVPDRGTGTGTGAAPNP